MYIDICMYVYIYKVSLLSFFYLYKVKQRALCLKEKQEVKVQDREQGGKEMARELG